MKKLFLVFIGIAIGLGTYAGRDDSAPTQQEIDNELQKLKNNMVLVEGGTFGMGVAAHETTVASFYISKYEVTQGLWRAVMGKLGYFDGSTRDDQLPLENRSWDACQQFISKLNEMTGEEYYMPTEAEWEFAARGGNKSQGYIYAGSNNLEEVAEWPATGKSRVGTKKPNELGLYDMTGNLAEWVADGESDELKAATRGGSYESPKDLLQVTCRGTGFYKSTSSYLIGLRLAKKATQQPAKRRPFFISYNKGGEEQQATVNGIRFIPSQYGKEAYAWQPADDEWQSYTSLAADGFDIQNVRSISRTRIELTESKGEELQQALEEEAQSGNADVNAIVAALQENPNVADAQTDGTNVIVRKENDNISIVYQMEQIEDPFSNEDLNALAARISQRSITTGQATNSSKKIAVFNYFTGINSRSGQNAIVDAMVKLFESYAYEVEYYDYKGFTIDKVNDVAKASRENNEYAAIFIFSHGFMYNNYGTKGLPFFVTGEELTDPSLIHANEIDEHYQNYILFSRHKYYNKAYHLSDLNVNTKCLLYVGSCHAFDRTDLLDNIPWIGWAGTNSMAQAHAAVMVSLMLEHDMNVQTATGEIWKSDDTGGSLKMNTSKIANFTLANYPHYDNKVFDTNLALEFHCFDGRGQKVLTGEKEMYLPIKGYMRNGQEDFRLELVPMMDGAETLTYNISVGTNRWFEKDIEIPEELRGLYRLEATYKSGWLSDRKYIRLTHPYYLAFSDRFKSNDAIVLKPAKDSKIVMTTSKPIGEKLYFNFRFSEDVWFDMNNNGIRESGESPTSAGYMGRASFEPTIQASSFAVYGHLGSQLIGASSKDDIDSFNPTISPCLTSIDMSEYTGELEWLWLDGVGLERIIFPKDSSKLETLQLNLNRLKEIDLSCLPNLYQAMLQDNQLTSILLPPTESFAHLDVSGNKQLKVIDLSKQPAMKSLWCEGCDIEKLDLTANRLLEELVCSGNHLTVLDVTANQRLNLIDCSNNQLDKNALEALYRQLPDYYSEYSSPYQYIIRANGNPGFYEADQSIATKKGWEFEDNSK